MGALEGVSWGGMPPLEKQLDVHNTLSETSELINKMKTKETSPEANVDQIKIFKEKVNNYVLPRIFNPDLLKFAQKTASVLAQDMARERGLNPQQLQLREEDFQPRDRQSPAAFDMGSYHFERAVKSAAEREATQQAGPSPTERDEANKDLEKHSENLTHLPAYNPEGPGLVKKRQKEYAAGPEPHAGPSPGGNITAEDVAAQQAKTAKKPHETT